MKKRTPWLLIGVLAATAAAPFGCSEDGEEDINDVEPAEVEDADALEPPTPDAGLPEDPIVPPGDADDDRLGEGDLDEGLNEDGDIIDEDDASDGPIDEIGAESPAEGYQGPAFLGEITPEEGDRGYVVTFRTTVPTGGWSLAVDDVRREGDVLRVFATLTRPGPDQVVTQALTDHEATVPLGVEPPAEVVLLVDLVRPGDPSDEATYEPALRVQPNDPDDPGAGSPE